MVQLQVKWGKGDWQEVGGFSQGHRFTGLVTVFTSLLCSL